MALLGRSDILSALADYAASQAALQLAVAKQYPDVHLTPGYSWNAGGAGENDAGIQRNWAALDAIELVPRYGVTTDLPPVDVELFGRRYSAPIGVAPMGGPSIVWPGAGTTETYDQYVSRLRDLGWLGTASVDALSSVEGDPRYIPGGGPCTLAARAPRHGHDRLRDGPPERGADEGVGVLLPQL